jgi:aminoglycoside/choline kinase family phosphotransferase
MDDRLPQKPSYTTALSRLFSDYFGSKPDHFSPLPSSGSRRLYFRLKNTDHEALGVFNPNKRENHSYLYFTRHFLRHNLPVPEILGENLTEHCYLIEDLGDETLYAHMMGQKQAGRFPTSLYESALEKLAFFQTQTSHGLDPANFCAPRPEFDHHAAMWDLNYFKYYFLRMGGFDFQENTLENDFQAFATYLNQANKEAFFYRDFQARNIMLRNGELYFIDFQDGRFGPPQYDVASLLFQAKAELSPELRENLLHTYLKHMGRYNRFSEKEFREIYHDIVLIRILQTLGAYGFRGFVEQKPHFLSSFPFALKNIGWLLEHGKLKAPVPYLKQLLKDISSCWQPLIAQQTRQYQGLSITINSFSYRNQIPVDYSGNGGGFVFDCRSLPNPGRLPEHKHLTGKDEPVIAFLNNQPEVSSFITQTSHIVDRVVQNYLDRDFQHLMINFGCTGGQHRSVYCAEQLAKHLNEKFPVEVSLTHIEQEKKGWIN